MTELTKNVKDLHLATNLEELQKIAFKDVTGFKQDKLMNSAEKLFRSALECVDKGDEEKAYVYFARFTKICELISKKNPNIVAQRLGGEMKTTNKLIKELTASLTERYSRLQVTIITLQDNLQPPDYNSIRNDNVDGGLVNNRKHPTILPSFQDGFVTSLELYCMINEKVDCVIFDTRSEEDYKCSSMKCVECVNIPDHIIKSGLSAFKLEQTIPPESLNVWHRRNSCAIMILVDLNTTRSTAATSKLTILKEIICRWDTEYNEQIEVVFLDGGYLQWWEDYPMYCTNAHNLHKERNMILSELIDLDLIDYPLASSNENADLPLPYAPTYDRSLKPGTVRPSRRIQDHADLRALWAEYHAQLETMSQKRRQELVDLRSQGLDKDKRRRLGDDLNDTDTRRELQEIGQEYDDAIAEVKAAEQDTTQPSGTKINNLRPSSAKTELDKVPDKTQTPSPTIATQHRLQRLTQRMLLEAREKKKPDLDLSGHSLSDVGAKKSVISVDYIKTSDLRRHLTADKTSEDSRSASLFNIPAIDKSKKPRRGFVPGVTGLKNLGNTCFMNSILQVFSNTKHIAQYFINYEHCVDLRDKDDNSGLFARYLGESIIALWAPDGKDPHYPHKLKKHTFANIPNFVLGHHQDAHEFFIKLVEYLHEELKQDLVVPKHIIFTPMQQAWVNQNGGKVSRINDWFLGQIRATMKCDSCDKMRDKFDTFYNLNLDLPLRTDECSINMCLDMYFQPQHLHGYKCPKCDNQESVTQTFQVAAYPPYIVITLNRFKLYDERRGTYTKNHVRVNYDMSLKLHSFKYNLYGVVYHFGEMGGGHYIAICQNPVNKQWYRFDDDYVDRVKPEAAISPGDVYLLFFQMDS